MTPPEMLPVLFFEIEGTQTLPHCAGSIMDVKAVASGAAAARNGSVKLARVIAAKDILRVPTLFRRCSVQHAAPRIAMVKNGKLDGSGTVLVSAGAIR